MFWTALLSAGAQAASGGAGPATTGAADFSGGTSLGQTFNNAFTVGGSGRIKAESTGGAAEGGPAGAGAGAAPAIPPAALLAAGALAVTLILVVAIKR